MRKKKPKRRFLISLLLLSASIILPAQAQVKEEAKPSSAVRQAKVKIFKQEGGTAYLLDTLLTLPEGVSYLEAVKQLKLDSLSFQKLGAKALEETRFSTAFGAEESRLFSGAAHDSLRAVVFRMATPDTLFARLKAIKVLSAKTLTGDSLARSRASTVAIYGNPALGRVEVDSLVRSVRFFRIDSLLHLKTDTIFRNQLLRVDKAKAVAEITINRLQEKNSGDVLKAGDYKILQLGAPGQEQIILLRKKGNAAAPDRKEVLKASVQKKNEAELASIELQLFPNPTNGEININFFSKKRAKAQVRVVDSQGKTVLEEDLGGVQGQVYKRYNLSRFGKGMYVVQVQLGKAAQAGKVVVE